MKKIHVQVLTHEYSTYVITGTEDDDQALALAIERAKARSPLGLTATDREVITADVTLIDESDA